MKIKQATRSDLAAILALQKLAYQSEAKLVGNEAIPPLLQTLEDLEQEYDAGVFLMALAEDGTIIGSVRAQMDGDTRKIGKLMVHPDVQGQGIGTKLLLTIERICPAKRYELFTSTLSVNNIRLYERVGYCKFEEKCLGDGIVLVYLEKRT